jgi:hypothetical protein
MGVRIPRPPLCSAKALGSKGTWRGGRAVEGARLLSACRPKGLPWVQIPASPPAVRAPIAQMDRALPCGGRGRRFNSSWARHLITRCPACQWPFRGSPACPLDGFARCILQRKTSTASARPGSKWRVVVPGGEEGWPSGRRRSTRNRLGAHKVPRGFESLSLRHRREREQAGGRFRRSGLA